MVQNTPVNSPQPQKTVNQLGKLMLEIAPEADISSTLDKFKKAIHGRINPAEWQSVEQAQADLKQIGFSNTLIDGVVKTLEGVKLLHDFLIDQQKTLLDTTEARGEIGKDALTGMLGDATEGLSEAYDKVFGDESELSGGAKLAAGIGLIALGIFVAKKAGAWFKTGPGQLAGGVLAGSAVYIGLAKLTETLTHGEQSLGLDTVGGWFDQMRGEDTDYLATYEKLNLPNNDWMNEWLATSKVPVKTLIKLWRQEGESGSGKRQINPDDPLIHRYLADLDLSDNETAKKKWGTDLYDMLNYIFDRKVYIDQWKHPHDSKDLLKNYEHSDITFGDFLTTLGAPEGRTWSQKFQDQVDRIRAVSSGAVSESIVSGVEAVAYTSAGIASLPLMVGDKVVGEAACDLVTGAWSFVFKDGASDDFINQVKDFRKKIAEF